MSNLCKVLGESIQFVYNIQWEKRGERLLGVPLGTNSWCWKITCKPCRAHAHLLDFWPSHLPVGTTDPEMSAWHSAIYQLELFLIGISTWFQGWRFKWTFESHHSAFKPLFPKNFEEFWFFSSCQVESIKVSSTWPPKPRYLACPQQERGGHVLFP